MPLGIINKISLSLDLIYILSGYSPFSDRVGLPLHNIHIPSPFNNIHIPSPFRLYNRIYFIM